jgi:hypothetical protein
VPNGGPDNCWTCGFNRRNWGEWRNPAPDENEQPFCRIRSVLVLADHWTYCENWHTRTSEPIGPIYAFGLYEDGYRRIPWDGNIEPAQIGTGICSECGITFAEGLEIATADGPLDQFCGNLHYLMWWTRKHPEENAPMSESIWKF